MAGCFGSSAVDRWMESSLNSYLDAGDADEYAFEKAERQYGACIYEEDGLHVFEEGAIGCPVMEEDWDKDGRCSSLGGLKECDVHKTKDGGYLVKTYKRVPSNRMSPNRLYGKTKKVVEMFIRIPPVQ